MERIAWILGTRTLYWSSLVLTLASAAAVCLFLALYLRKSENSAAAFTVVPLAMVLSLFFARLVHWYCFDERYESMLSALTNFSVGGFALIGVFAGCLLAAVLTRLVGLHRNLPQMLDCLCLAGAAGIAAGRLASFFNSSDRGQLIDSIRTMPWVYPVTNSVTGALEYRLATFLLQAMAAALIFLILAAFYLSRKPKRDGDTALLFLLCYSASQILLDSTRYDSIYFRSNGFVSIVQVFSAIALALVIVVFSVRLVRGRGFRGWYVLLWVALAALMGGAGYMEYHVQRHGNEAVFAYSVMGTCLFGIILLTVFLRLLAEKTAAPVKGRFQKA